MKQLSFWAKTHKHTARLLIIFCYVLLNLLGWQVGQLLNQSDVLLSEPLLAVLVILYLLGIALYPAKQLREKWGLNKYYYRQKTVDFLLISSTFGMIVYVVNHTGPVTFVDNVYSAVSNKTSPPEDSMRKYKSIMEFAAAMKDKNGMLLKWNVRKKILKQQLHDIKKAPELSGTGRTFLTILFLLLAVGLELGVLSLSCSLSCSGSEGAALIVGIGGTALVIFLAAISIRALQKQKQAPAAPQPSPPK